jgi:two-component system nitrogen regulation response regulator GlnG
MLTLPLALKEPLVRARPELLVVERDHGVRELVRMLFLHAGYRALTALSGAEGLEVARRHNLAAALVPLWLPDTTGPELIRRLRAVRRRLPIILLAAFAERDSVPEEVARDGVHVFGKPFDIHKLLAVVQAAVAGRPPAPGPEGLGLRPVLPNDGLVGSSPALARLQEEIRSFETVDLPVLMDGESGTGKECVAQAIQRRSRRAGKPFVRVNCAALNETLLESELFGHEKGAFTGADSRRAGKFQAADGGTLFFDEVGDMSPAMQAKLLRAVEEMQVTPVGADQPVKVNCRLLAATHHDLDRRAREGSFRHDLFYRLERCRIHVPPLRERVEDIPLLVDFFLRITAFDHGLVLPRVTGEAMRLLQAYRWPGNVRELENAVTQAHLRSGDWLTAGALPETVRRPAAVAAAHFDLQARIRELLPTEKVNLYDVLHDEIDRVLLPLVLEESAQNKTLAARRLGISRTTLGERLAHLGLTPRLAERHRPKSGRDSSRIWTDHEKGGSP